MISSRRILWLLALRRCSTALLIWILALASPAAPLAAQDMPVPIDLQVPLFLKVLYFDRNLKARAGGELVIGVLFQKRHRESLNAKNGFVSALAGSGRTDVAGLPFRHVEIDLDREEDLSAALAREGIDVLYVAPLRAVSLSAVTRSAKEAGILTLSGIPDHVVAGVMVGITERRSRPSILVNLEVAKAANVDFRADLLKVAEVVSR